MPGYRLVELRNLRPHKPRGMHPAGEAIGILDFLRELAESPFPLPKFSKWQVAGLEDVLFAARPREEEAALEIHRRLNDAASDLERRLLDVQVVLSGEIVRGAHMTVKYRGASLPLFLIFNNPLRKEDGNGNPYYPVEFHLSSP